MFGHVRLNFISCNILQRRLIKMAPSRWVWRKSLLDPATRDMRTSPWLFTGVSTSPQCCFRLPPSQVVLLGRRGITILGEIGPSCCKGLDTIRSLMFLVGAPKTYYWYLLIYCNNHRSFKISETWVPLKHCQSLDMSGHSKLQSPRLQDAVRPT